MINFIADLLDGCDANTDVMKGLDANTMERLIMCVIPIHRISTTRVLIGTQIKTISARSDRIMIVSGGGAITIEDHWRTVSVGEMLRLNKVLNSNPNLTMTKAISQIFVKDGGVPK